MLKRYWGEGTAVGLVLGLCLAILFFVSVTFFLGQVNCQKYDQSSQSSASQSEAKKKNCHPPGWWKITQSLVSSEDTLAQWIMAFFTLTALLVSGWGVWLVNRTLRETVQSTREAKRSADIAESALFHAERPHLFVEQVHAVAPFFKMPRETIVRSKDFFEVVFVIKNYGNSPAIILEQKRALFFGDHLPEIPEFLPSDCFEILSPLGPHPSHREGMMFLRRRITDEEAATFHAGNVHIEGTAPTNIYAFFYHRYRSPFGTIDEIASVFRYIYWLDQFVEETIHGYTFRRLGPKPQTSTTNGENEE